MPTILLKTDPETYSWDDLARDRKTVWNGVGNNAALMHMRAAKKGDEALIYHSGGDKAIVGLATLTTDPYPDPEADDPKRVVFEIRAERAAPNRVSLAEIKADDRFQNFGLVTQSRLSVMPVPVKLDSLLRKMAKL